MFVHPIYHLLFSVAGHTAVSIHFATEANRCEESLPEDFKARVLRQVYLEIACVGLRKLAVASRKALQMVLVAELRQVSWQFGLAVDKSKVQLAIFFGHFFHNLPEPLFAFRSGRVEVRGIARETLQVLDVSGLLSNASLFCIPPAELVGQLRCGDEVDTFLDLFHLLVGLVK